MLCYNRKSRKNGEECMKCFNRLKFLLFFKKTKMINSNLPFGINVWQFNNNKKIKEIINKIPNYNVCFSQIKYNINLFWGSNNLENNILNLGTNSFNDIYNIIYVDKLNTNFRLLNKFNEIWVPTHYLANNIRSNVKPLVYIIPNNKNDAVLNIINRIEDIKHKMM